MGRGSLLVKIDFGVSTTGEQFYKLEKTSKNRKEIVQLKNRIIQRLKDEGKYLTFIGVKVNGVGSNNPLLMPKNCVTPSYRFLYNMNKLVFKFKEDGVYEYMGEEGLILNLEFDEDALKMKDLRDKLDSEGILVYSDIEDDTVLLHGNNVTIELELLLKIVGSDYDINKYSHEMDLKNYYLPINSKAITQRTKFNNDEFYFEIYPRLENFNQIMNKVSSE